MKIILDIALNHTSSEVSLDRLQRIDQIINIKGELGVLTDCLAA